MMFPLRVLLDLRLRHVPARRLPVPAARSRNRRVSGTGRARMMLPFLHRPLQLSVLLRLPHPVRRLRVLQLLRMSFILFILLLLLLLLIIIPILLRLSWAPASRSGEPREWCTGGRCQNRTC